MTNGNRLLRIAHIKKEIEKLKEEKRRTLFFKNDDIVEIKMRIAFSDIKSFIEWGNENNKNYVKFKNSNIVDGGIIHEVKKGKDGISIKLQDKQKALDWLAEYFMEHPMDKHKKEYDKEIIKLKQKQLNHTIETDKKKLELEERKLTVDSKNSDNKKAIKEFIEATKLNDEELDELFEEELKNDKTEE